MTLPSCTTPRLPPLACLPYIRYLSWADKVAYLAWQFKKVEITLPPLEHRFEDGWYVRTMRIPGESVFVGRVHLKGHICKLLRGKVMLVHELGQRYYEAKTVIQTLPGYQMVLYVMEDLIGETWHPNPSESRDIDKLENEIFEPVEAISERGRIVASQVDYHQIISQLGMTEQQYQELIASSYAKGVSSVGQEKVYVAESAYGGKGCFSGSDFSAGECVGPAVLADGAGTILSRYTNHSLTPNLVPEQHRGETWFCACKQILSGEELTVDYRGIIQKRLA